MPETICKWWYVTRDDSGKITEAAARFYEGEYAENSYPDFITGEIRTETVFVPTRRLGPSSGEGVWKSESDGSFARVYSERDFGDIRTDLDLRAFTDGEAAKIQVTH